MGHLGVFLLIFFFFLFHFPGFINYSGSMRTMVLGDSMVRRVAARKVQLVGGGHTVYCGEGGSQIGKLREMTLRHLSRRRNPTTLIIHLGTNDLFVNSLNAIRYRIEENIRCVRKLLPQTRLIWSDILPRPFYLRESPQSKGAGKRCTINLNEYAHKLCTKIPNMRYITHRNFSYSDHTLFYWDSVHLSNKGHERLLDNWSKGLVFLNSNPNVLGYCPVCP